MMVDCTTNPPTPFLWQAPASAQKKKKRKRKTRRPASCFVLFGSKKKKNFAIKTRPRRAFGKRPPAPRKPKGKPGRSNPVLLGGVFVLFLHAFLLFRGCFCAARGVFLFSRVSAKCFAVFFFFEGAPHRNGEFPLWRISAIYKAGLSAPARTTHKSTQIPRSRPTWLNRDSAITRRCQAAPRPPVRARRR